MSKIYKILALVLAVLILTAATNAENEDEVIQTNGTGLDINSIQNSAAQYTQNITDIKTIKIDRMKKARVRSEVINATINITKPPTTKTPVIYSYVSYTNPISGISVFGTDFYEDIYSADDSQWTSYTFYLPVAAYVYMSMSGTIGYVDYIGYGSWIDSDFPFYNYDDVCGNWACEIGIQKSSSVYLTKGYHTVYVNGYMADLPYYDELCDCYYSVVTGSISIIAIPEYTAITVTSPNGGENWSRGIYKTITWKKYGKPGANVKIELYKVGVKYADISSKTPNDGSYSWYIPTYQPVGSDYKLKITSYEESKYYDWSNNYFKIY